MEALAGGRGSGLPRRKDFTAAAMKQLAAHGWPLNETELHNLLGALAGRREGGPVQLQQLLPLLERGATTETDRRSAKDRIVDALWRHGLQRRRTAADIGLPRRWKDTS